MEHVYVVFPLDNWRWLLDLLAEDVALDKVWKPHSEFVAEEVLCWDGEDLVDFFERELLGLAHKGEDHEPGYEIQAGIETNCNHSLAWKLYSYESVGTYMHRLES